LEGFLVESGFVGNNLVSRSGRSFQIVFQQDDIPAQRNGVMGFFHLRELKFSKSRAYYMIGLDQNLVEDWKIENAIDAVEQVGVALLHFYNRKFEIDRLRWPHPAGIQEYDGYRILSWNDVGRAQSLNEFLDFLRTNSWTDLLVQEADQSQDIRRGRNPADLFR
jgi:hypothetical protein